MAKREFPPLLITSTISVNNNMPFVVITDLNTRLKQYLNTIKWSIEQSPFVSIVYCDNSGYKLDVTEIKRSARIRNKRFEYISFFADMEQMLKKGKGYGEGEIISYALDNSTIMKNAEFFCKLTGRTTINNVNRCILKIQNYFMEVEGEEKIDTRFYCVRVSDYNRVLRYAYLNVDDRRGFYLENIFYLIAKTKKLNYRCFHSLPLFSGVSGSTGLSYDRRMGAIEYAFISVLCKLNVYNSIHLFRIVGLLRKIKSNIYSKLNQYSY